MRLSHPNSESDLRDECLHSPLEPKPLLPLNPAAYHPHGAANPTPTGALFSARFQFAIPTLTAPAARRSCFAYSTPAPTAGVSEAISTTATKTPKTSERDIPAMADFVPGYEASGWFGVGAPRNTPVEITDKLNKEINAGLADLKLKERFADLGGMVFPGSPTDFGKFISEETEKWAKVVKFAGIKAD
jgi:hypothetical protein